MKKRNYILIIISILLLTSMLFGFVSCNNDDDGKTLRFAAPEGTPALAFLRLASQSQGIEDYSVDYDVVSPSNIAAEMSSKKADLVIMPVNAGANLIRQGADYKLVTVAVDGSLFMVGKKDVAGEITFDDIKGKKIACIGQTGVPGLIFRYLMNKNGITIISDGTPTKENNEVLVQYVSDGPAAKQLLANGTVDFAVVGEPAATQFKNALGLNSEMNMQTAYANADPANGTTYPQAGLFVKSDLTKDEEFMEDLFNKLQASKEWALNNAGEVQSEAQKVYESAVFPKASISRCAINVLELNDTDNNNIIKFLKNVMPKDSSKNTIDWDSAKELIF